MLAFQKAMASMAARLVEYRRSWYFYLFLPEWRNGRRGGLKIRCPQGRVGSTPSSGTLAFCFRSNPAKYAFCKTLIDSTLQGSATE